MRCCGAGRARLVPRWSLPVVADAKPPAASRDPYYRNGEVRTLWRGNLMHYLLPLWPLLICIYWALPLFGQTDVVEHMLHDELVPIRVAVGLATLANIFLSDKFHNGDRRGEALAQEIRWLRLDFIGISAVLTSTFALWSAHFGWRPPFAILAGVCTGATVVVAVVSFGLFETDPERTCAHDPAGVHATKAQPGPRTHAATMAIKATLGLQFLVAFGYMMYDALPSPCAPYLLIWFVYLPGFCAYVLQWPADVPQNRVGGHDVFHLFVVAGHVASMVCDVLQVRLQVDCSDAW